MSRDGTIVNIYRTLTNQPIRLVEEISITGEHEAGTYQRRQRLYEGNELCAALKRAGFIVVGLFSGYSGEPFDPARSRTIMIVGERPTETAQPAAAADS
jgi:hypothetical protein